MHAIFSVIQETLLGSKVPAALPIGRIRFVVLGPEPERWLVELEHTSCRLRADASELNAELTLFCDAPQLERMLTSGTSARPLRFDGNDALLDSLAAAMSPARSLLEARIEAKGPRE